MLLDFFCLIRMMYHQIRFIYTEIDALITCIPFNSFIAIANQFSESFAHSTQLSDIESNESALFLVHSSHIFSHTKISMRTVERKLWHITEDKKIETGQ